MKRYLLAGLLFLAGPLFGAEIKVPAEIKVKSNRLARIVVDCVTPVKYICLSPGVDVFREYDPQKYVFRLYADKDGSYPIGFFTGDKDGPSDPAICTVIVGDPVPPGPVPPGPNPPIPPVPPGPAPIPGAGFKALMVFETADLSKLPPAQQLVLYAKSVRDYLNEKCVTEADGKTKGWRLWDQNVSTANETPAWQEAMKLPRASVPWLILSNPAKPGGGYQGPLPATVDDMLKLLKQWGD